ncbi:MAG: hypothetical protein AAFU71_19840 [Cyanobacteria bacterium J06632_22]
MKTITSRLSTVQTVLHRAARVSLIAGICLSVGAGSALAQSRVQRGPGRAPIRTNPGVTIGAPGGGFIQAYSLTGSWTGTMAQAGDDVVIHYELTIQSNGQGSWRILGSEYNAQLDQWLPAILDEGTLTASVSQNNASIQLNNTANQSGQMQLSGTFQSGGSQLSGQSTDFPGIGFNFVKD